MASVNQTRPRCVNQMGKTHSKPLAARHGRGTAWARHAMCESAFNHFSTKFEKFAWLLIDAKVRRSLKRTENFSRLMTTRFLIREVIVTMGEFPKSSQPPPPLKK